MFRNISQKLLHWKNSSTRKPLILMGARQVGKTYALREFGQQHFAKLHYLDFQRDQQAHELFAGNLVPEDLLKNLELYLESSLDIQKDLIVFDEIQECPRALTSLKYFYEEKPELALCAAGSLLGVTHTQGSFPVGKVEFLEMQPLSFLEFLLALKEKRAYQLLVELKTTDSIPEFLHERLLEKLRYYFVIGGMPEAVQTYLKHPQDPWEALQQVRGQQQYILDAYLRDFAKHAGQVSSRDIVRVFESIPTQIAKENKKFKFSALTPKGRYQKFAAPIDWLVGAGLVHKVKIINRAELPLEAFTQENRFKLYGLDVGLLGAMAGLSPKTLILNQELFATFKGAFCENFVAQSLRASGIRQLYAWASNTAEIEFLYEKEGNILPIEVKAGRSGRLKSLNVFTDRFNSPYRIRMSAHNLQFRKESKFLNLPLYLSERVHDFL